MNMANNAGGFDNESPASPPTPHGKVCVFVIEKETLLKQTNVFKVTCPQQNSRTAPSPDLLHIVEVTTIDFIESALMTNP